MLLNGALILIALVAGALLLWPRLSGAKLWQATITPLASIIGSGFLVLGPILNDAYGYYAPLVMAALCATAYLFGWAIRYNIAAIETDESRTALETHLERIASWVLSFAYVISVSYYLNLFGAFGVSLTPFDGPDNARLLTTAMLLLILCVGWLWGFKALERMEQVSVGIKLAVIAALLAGLAWYFYDRTTAGALQINPPGKTGWTGIALAFGLIVTVQGFETARYLGSTYEPRIRIRAMRLSQWLSAAIYMIYIVLLSYVFRAGQFKLDETAIIDMMAVVAPVLPGLLVLAALSAQFSAAVADTSGAGGLMEEESGGRIPQRFAYLALVTIGILLTWVFNVFEIVSYASRAFALYYAIQSAIAAAAAQRRSHRVHAVTFLVLALLGTAIFVFGQPAE